MRRMVGVAGRKVVVLEFTGGVGKWGNKERAREIRWVGGLDNGDSKTFI